MTSFANEFPSMNPMIILMVTNYPHESTQLLQGSIFGIFQQKINRRKHIHNLKNTHNAFLYKRNLNLKFINIIPEP